MDDAAPSPSGPAVTEVCGTTPPPAHGTRVPEQASAAVRPKHGTSLGGQDSIAPRRTASLLHHSCTMATPAEHQQFRTSLGGRESAAPRMTASACATPAFDSADASVGSPSAHVILHRRMGPAAPSGKPCSAVEHAISSAVMRNALFCCFRRQHATRVRRAASF